MLATAVLAAGILAAGANAAISISNPVTGQTWYQNDSVALNWTAGPDDPTYFRVLISNDNNTSLLPTNPHELAQQVTTQDDYFRISLGQIQPGDGFTLQFVNTTNSSQVYAQVEELKVEPGIPATSTIPVPSSSVAASTSAVAIPNVATTSPTAAASSANPFASASATHTGGAASHGPAAVGVAVVAAVAAALAL